MEKTPGNRTGATVVQMLEPEVVVRIRLLQQLGWGTKRIAREVGAARNSVRGYLREGAAAEKQERPGAWTMDASQQAAARELLDGPAAGKLVVEGSVRTDGVKRSTRYLPTTKLATRRRS